MEQIYGYTEPGASYPAYLAIKKTEAADGLYVIARAQGNGGNNMGNIVVPTEEVPRLIEALTKAHAELVAAAHP